MICVKDMNTEFKKYKGLLIIHWFKTYLRKM